MDMNNLTKEELIHQNQELREEINTLKSRYVWGLQVEDFASAYIGAIEARDNDSEIFTREELSDDELHYQTFHALRVDEKYSLPAPDWYEDIAEASFEFSEHTMKLLRTISKRWVRRE